MYGVSVVIPLYNKQAYICRAVDSVLKQTYPCHEILIIDDGSTDRGAQLARGYTDERVRVLSIERAGTSAARNAGIDAARYDLIAFLDADDEWHPHFLKTVLALHQAYPQAGLFAGAYETSCAGKRRRAPVKGLPGCFWQGLMPNYFYSVSGRSIPVISSAVMVPRSVFERVGTFAQGAQLGEDQDMWCRIALNYPVAYTKKPCAVYYLDSQGSVCGDISIMQTYPVITTVKIALSWYAEQKKWLLKYLSKLYLDYAVRLIRARRFCEARAAIRKTGLRMPAMRLRTEYYYIHARLKKLYERISHRAT